jgi:hypothetical protein
MGVCVALWDPSVALMDVPTLTVQLREGGAHLLSHLVIELSATVNYPELAAQHRVVPAGHRSARTTPLVPLKARSLKVLDRHSILLEFLGQRITAPVTKSRGVAKR